MEELVEARDIALRHLAWFRPEAVARWVAERLGYTVERVDAYLRGACWLDCPLEFLRLGRFLESRCLPLLSPALEWPSRIVVWRGCFGGLTAMMATALSGPMVSALVWFGNGSVAGQIELADLSLVTLWDVVGNAPNAQSSEELDRGGSTDPEPLRSAVLLALAESGFDAAEVEVEPEVSASYQYGMPHVKADKWEIAALYAIASLTHADSIDRVEVVEGRHRAIAAVHMRHDGAPRRLVIRSEWGLNYDQLVVLEVEEDGNVYGYAVTRYVHDPRNRMYRSEFVTSVKARVKNPPG